MHLFKRIVSATTGYWIHKVSTLPVGTDLYVDIHRRIGTGAFKTMFDVGANIGQTWEWFRNNESGATIYCFEPVSATFRELKEKTKNDSKCIIENIAFGDHPCEKKIKIFSGNSALNSLRDDVMNDDSNAKEETITVDTLDNYCKRMGIDSIDFLKIDTEGYELNVLQGAEHMLESGRILFVFCEVGFLRRNNRNTYLADVTEWLYKRDYNFSGLYQLVSNGQNIEFGNALFVHKSILDR